MLIFLPPFPLRPILRSFWDRVRRQPRHDPEFPLFCLDSDVGDHLPRIVSVSGWYIPSPNETIGRLFISLNGKPSFDLIRTHRHDVAAVFPIYSRAVLSGFLGDIVLAESWEEGDQVKVSIEEDHEDGCRTLFQKICTVSGGASLPPPRKKSFDLSDILLSERGGGRPDTVIHGVPHFHLPGQLPIVRLTATGSTHPYSDKALTLIETGGLVLDFGAGIQTPERLYPHVVTLEAVQFPYVDVVNTRRCLPFRDEVFSAVVSQAVFEHLPDPFAAAREIWRVLKPGGRVLIDTAFMQPFHGDPNHYFNMTLSGLKEIMAGYAIEEIGVRPYQNPSYGLAMQIESVLPFVMDFRWYATLSKLLTRLRKRGDVLDRCLGEVGREVIAAGVYVLARKSG